MSQDVQIARMNFQTRSKSAYEILYVSHDITSNYA